MERAHAADAHTNTCLYKRRKTEWLTVHEEETDEPHAPEDLDENQPADDHHADGITRESHLTHHQEWAQSTI